MIRPPVCLYTNKRGDQYEHSVAWKTGNTLEKAGFRFIVVEREIGAEGRPPLCAKLRSKGYQLGNKSGLSVRIEARICCGKKFADLEYSDQQNCWSQEKRDQPRQG